MIFKCKNCGGNTIYSPERKTMYCPFCDSQDSQERTEETCDMQTCPNCGGEIQVEEHTSALQCPYCDHYIILNERVEGTYEPEKIIPFKYSKDMVKELMRENFKKHRFAPTDFLSEVRLNSMTGEYVPFWMYDYHTNCDYQGEGIKTRVWVTGDMEYTETSFYNVVRNMDINYQEIPADASVSMPDTVMDLLEPYQYNELTDFKPEYMSGFLGEKYNMSSELVEGRAKAKMSESAEVLLKQSISGYARVNALHKNIRADSVGTHYDLLPVWKYDYTYKEQSFPFYINGQTGKVVGRVPISKEKVWAYGATLWASLTAVIALAGCIVGMIFL